MVLHSSPVNSSERISTTCTCMEPMESFTSLLPGERYSIEPPSVARERGVIPVIVDEVPEGTLAVPLRRNWLLLANIGFIDMATSLTNKNAIPDLPGDATTWSRGLLPVTNGTVALRPSGH